MNKVIKTLLVASILIWTGCEQTAKKSGTLLEKSKRIQAGGGRAPFLACPAAGAGVKNVSITLGKALFALYHPSRQFMPAAGKIGLVLESIPRWTLVAEFFVFRV